MTITATLTARSHNAAEYIKKVGWTQGRGIDPTGRVCKTHAIMCCQPKNGDEQVIIAMLRKHNTAEAWNDKEGRTVEEVIADLNRDITDADLAATFGPQWVEVIALTREFASLTVDQVAALRADEEAVWLAAWSATRNEPWVAARTAAWVAARDGTRDGEMNAAGNAARNAAWYAGGEIARHTAWALVTRDLIGQHGYTQEHYDTLTGPWVSVMGKVHEGDSDV